MYAKCLKRGLDFFLSLIALIILSPLLIILIVAGAVCMRGNPFFTQERPGKNEKIFKLIKLRTMDNRTDKDGKLLKDEVRLNKYGRFLRASSLDELPELINILKETWLSLDQDRCWYAILTGIMMNSVIAMMLGLV